MKGKRKAETLSKLDLRKPYFRVEGGTRTHDIQNHNLTL